MSLPSPARLRIWASLAIATTLLGAPTGLGALEGSGNVTDIVNLVTVTATISGADLTSVGGAPVASPTPLQVHNSDSNVDTYIKYEWSASPYYGSGTSQSSISIRGATHYMGDLAWFEQESITGDGTKTRSSYYSPMFIKKAADIATSTWTLSGNACTDWGAAPTGFSPASAGYFTFKYHANSSQTDNTPSTSDTFHFCLDTTNKKVYIGKWYAYGNATLVHDYSLASAGGVLLGYHYEFLSGAQTTGNKYCLDGFTSTGTAATPNLVQCQKMAYNLLGSAKALLYVLFDPPAYFPSTNQGGGAQAFKMPMKGTQWNPYAPGTTNLA